MDLYNEQHAHRQQQQKLHEQHAHRQKQQKPHEQHAHRQQLQLLLQRQNLELQRLNQWRAELQRQRELLDAQRRQQVQKQFQMYAPAAVAKSHVTSFPIVGNNNTRSVCTLTNHGATVSVRHFPSINRRAFYTYYSSPFGASPTIAMGNDWQRQEMPPSCDTKGASERSYVSVDNDVFDLTFHAVAEIFIPLSSSCYDSGANFLSSNCGFGSLHGGNMIQQSNQFGSTCVIAACRRDDTCSDDLTTCASNAYSNTMSWYDRSYGDDRYDVSHNGAVVEGFTHAKLMDVVAANRCEFFFIGDQHDLISQESFDFQVPDFVDDIFDITFLAVAEVIIPQSYSECNSGANPFSPNGDFGNVHLGKMDQQPRQARSGRVIAARRREDASYDDLTTCASNACSETTSCYDRSYGDDFSDAGIILPTSSSLNSKCYLDDLSLDILAESNYRHDSANFQCDLDDGDQASQTKFQLSASYHSSPRDLHSHEGSSGFQLSFD